MPTTPLHSQGDHRAVTASWWQRIEEFWLHRELPTSLGLARILWGAITLYAFLVQWDDIVLYVSDDGYFPHPLWQSFTRQSFRFSLFDTLRTGPQVFGLYLVLLGTLVLATLGIFTRPAMVIAYVLIASFHEKAIFTLEGGDTVIRLVGVILLLSPCGRSLSLSSLWRRLSSFQRTGRDVPLEQRRLPIWPRHLLFWQLLTIYVTTGWYKTLGTLWWDGSAVFYALHHEHFQRFPDRVLAIFDPFSKFITWFVLWWELLWVLPLLHWLLLQGTTGSLREFLRRIPLKRSLLLGGLLMHLGIFLLMDVGSFSLALSAAYVGALSAEDLCVIRDWWNRRWRQRHGGGAILVLYDGRCRLCLRSIFVLQILDGLQRLQCVDFTSRRLHEKFAPDLSQAALERALHVRLPSGETFAGFDAFRALTRHLPGLWTFLPLLYLPGVAAIGRKIYAHIAARRVRCIEGACEHRPPAR